MPNKHAAKTAYRKSVKQAASNARIKTNVKALYVKCLNVAKEGKKSDVKEAVKKYQQAVDKAVKARVISKNSASRAKSDLMKIVNTVK